MCLSGYIFWGPDMPTVDPILQAFPEGARSCGEVIFSAVSSTSGYGRPMQFLWRLHGNPHEVQGAFKEPLLDTGARPTLIMSARQMGAMAAGLNKSIVAQTLLLHVQVLAKTWLKIYATPSVTVPVQDSHNKTIRAFCITPLESLIEN